MTSQRPVLNLRGLRPQPLAAYLAALGVLRIVATQRRRSVRGWFSTEGFCLEGIERRELVDLLLDDWAPAPIVSPWNNASGFYQSSKGQLAAGALEAVLATSLPRFEPLRGVIRQVRELVAMRGYADAPEKEEKARFLVSLRRELPDEAVTWLDAVAVVDGDDARMMPILGSGGNEGVLDYSGLFLRSIRDTLLGERSRSERLLCSALFGDATNELVERPGGQFDPGTAGGFNTGPGFESKDLPNNPWSFMLLIEGALVWVSGLASRQQGTASGYRLAVSPFTVRHRASGYGSAGENDDDPQRVRAEVWLPVWRRPTSLAELSRFIAEGRMEVRSGVTRAARAVDSIDFVDAVTSLGVDRGVDSFVRCALIKRRGDAYIALPAGVLDVRQRQESDLLRQVDRATDVLDRFLASFPSEQGPPASLASQRRAIDEARFDVAARGGPQAMTRLVRAIGALEMTLARRDPTKEPRLRRPLGGLGAEWVAACEDSTEVRIASALSAIGATGGSAFIRAYLAPISPRNPREFAAASRTLAWAGADLSGRLAAVLHRRFLDVRSRSVEERQRGRNPTWSPRSASLADVAAFLAGEVDEAALEELLFGFTWVETTGGARTTGAPPGPPLARAYALLRLLFLPDGVPHGGGSIPIAPDASLVPLLIAGRISDAVAVARRQLVAAGLRPRRVVDPDVVDAALGRRIAAALLIPVRETNTLMRAALVPTEDTESTPTFQNEETRNAR